MVSNLGAHVAMTSNLFVIHLVVRVGPAGRCVDKLLDCHRRRLDGRSVDQLADDDIHRDGMMPGIHCFIDALKKLHAREVQVR